MLYNLNLIKMAKMTVRPREIRQGIKKFEGKNI